MDSGYLLTFVRGQKFFELTNHLGNVLATVADRKIGIAKADGVTVSYYAAVVVSAQDYYPFGTAMPGRQYHSGSYAFGFNGKRMDNDIEGTGVDYDYGARIYDARVGRFLSGDPLQTKYPGIGPYAFGLNNPIIFKDPNGNDIVYFNNEGHEILRITSTTRFETYVQTSTANTTAHKAFDPLPYIAQSNNTPVPLVGEFVKVSMPKIVKARPGHDGNQDEPTTDPAYQKNDYLIAAQTYVFNKQKNDGTLKVYKDDGNQIPTDDLKKIPDIDVTYTKAIAIQESMAGVSAEDNEKKDIIQINNGLSNNKDWSKHLNNYGLSKGTLPTSEQSLFAGLREIAYKGYKGGISYTSVANKDTYSYTFSNWPTAAQNYNHKISTYSADVTTMFNNAQTPTTNNYVPAPSPVKKPVKKN